MTQQPPLSHGGAASFFFLAIGQSPTGDKLIRLHSTQTETLTSQTLSNAARNNNRSPRKPPEAGGVAATIIYASGLSLCI